MNERRSWIWRRICITRGTVHPSYYCRSILRRWMVLRKGLTQAIKCENHLFILFRKEVELWVTVMEDLVDVAMHTLPVVVMDMEALS